MVNVESLDFEQFAKVLTLIQIEGTLKDGQAVHILEKTYLKWYIHFKNDETDEVSM